MDSALLKGWKLLKKGSVDPVPLETTKTPSSPLEAMDSALLEVVDFVLLEVVETMERKAQSTRQP